MSLATTRGASPARREVAPARTVATPIPSPAEQPTERLPLDGLALRWQRALDAGERALHAAAGALPSLELNERRLGIARERRETIECIADVARLSGVRPAPWLSPVPVTVRMLGLPADMRACLFDLDGVLSDSAALHAWAWGEVFDALLLRLSEDTGWQFRPFDRRADYRTYIEGRARLEGIHSFLDSRGIRLPEGRLDDSPQAQTAWALAKRKGETMTRGLQQRGVTSLPGVRRYLEAAGQAGLGRAVVSASASTLPMLELAALATLVEAHVDADVIRDERIRTPPAPDLLLAACRRLAVPPASTVTFTHSAAGVAAGRAAGLLVIGVAEGVDEEILRGFGASRVVPSLSALLDRRLLASGAEQLR